LPVPDDRTDLVVLTTTRREFEAATIAEALHSHRIAAEVAHADAASANAGGPTAREHRVLVRAADLKRAQDLLKFIQAQSMHLSWATGPSQPAPGVPSAVAKSASSEPIGAVPSAFRDAAPAPRREVAAAAPVVRPPAAQGAPASGSRSVPIIVAVVVIAAFVLIVLAIIGRPAAP